MFETKRKKLLAGAAGLTAGLMAFAAGAGLVQSFGGLTADAASADYNYFKCDFANAGETVAAAKEHNIKIAEEGFTLLKNDGGLLPMQPKAGQSKIKASMFGNHSESLITCGFGSSDTNVGSVFVYDAFADSDFELNPTLKDFYANDGVAPTSGHDGVLAYNMGLPVRETPIEKYTEEVKNSYKDYNDVAIVFLSRTGGEGGDLPQVSLKSDFAARTDEYKVEGARHWNSHYLQINEDEVDMLQMVMDNFDDIVLIINCSSYVELGFLNDPTHYLYTDNDYATDENTAEEKMSKFKSVINVGMPGTDAIKALPRIMQGDVNPSGHLPDTWVKDMTKDPTYQNTGLSGMTKQELKYGEYYVHYDEDIYMGYRYYETRYAEEDPVSRDAWYEDNVMFPFGYGLSYTTFSQEIISSSPAAGEQLEKDGTIKVTVRVTNTGEVAGKDVVQLYYNAPYYRSGIAKAHVNLGAFEKTDLLEPGEHQDVTLELKVSDMYSYDWSDANGNDFKGYELDPGDYNIIIGTDAHDAAQLPKARTITYNIAEGYTYENDTTTGAPVENRFDYASGDPSKENDPETFQGVRKYMSRDDFAGTFPTHASTKHTGMQQQKVVYDINEATDKQMPWYSDDMPDYAETPGNSETNEIKLWHMSGRDYDDPLWEDFLDQFTIQEMAERIGDGFQGPAGLDSIDMPDVYDTDGPLGRKNSGDIQWVSNPILASTWNKELAYRQGVIFGNTIFPAAEGKGGTYGVGLNIHRNAFGGRNFEYYSEDGILAGEMGAQVVAGSNTKGCYQIVKHLLLNDQETERNTISTWASEQAIREIYGKAFEIAIKEGGAIGIMTSVTSVGNIPCSVNYDLLEGLVRGEWGFEGMIITDMYCEDTDASIRAGTDTMMASPNPQPPTTDEDSLTSTQVTAMRRAMKNILFLRANSSGVNGVGGEPLDRINYVGTDALYAVQNVENELTVATATVGGVKGDLKYTLREGSEMPAGLTLNEDGSITGAPEQSGTFTFSVVASEDTEAWYPYKDKAKTFRMTVYAQDDIPDQIIYEDINLGVIPYGYDYNQSIAGAVVFDENGKITTDIDYSLAEGSSLPRGLTLENGMITGKATAAPGTYFFTIEASKEGKQSALLDVIVTVKAYSITYEPPAQALPDLVIGEEASIDVGTATTDDGIDIKYALKDGSTLPAGLTLSSSGVISGVPVRAYNGHEFTIVASGDLAPSQEVTYKLTVRGVVFEDRTFDGLIIGKDYRFSLTAEANNGSQSPIYFELKEGSVLPNGFSLLADGTLIGSGSDWGEQTFTVVARSEGNVTVEAQVTMNFYTVFEEAVEGEPSEPIEPSAGSGCSAQVGGGTIAMLVAAAAAVCGAIAIRKITYKKEK